MSVTITFAGTGPHDGVFGQVTVKDGDVDVSSPFIADHLLRWVDGLPPLITDLRGYPIDRRLDGTDEEAAATVIAALLVGIGPIEATTDLPDTGERLVGPPDAPQ